MMEPSKKYQVVLCDPPWSYYGQQDKWGAAAKFYPTMTDEELLAFPIQAWLEKPSILFMWTTGPRLDFSITLLKAWNLAYRGVAFVWVKTTTAGVPIGAQGVRPSIVKPLTEFVLSASTEARGRPLKLMCESVRQTIFHPVMEHSRKPNAVHEAIEKMYPYASKAELFARRPRAGWDVYGNEV